MPLRTATVVLLAALAALASGPPVAALPESPEFQSCLDSLVAWHEAGRPDKVDSLAGPAIAAARAAADTLRLLPLLTVRGAARAAVGNVRPAEADLREALALATDRHDTLRQLQTLRWLGIAVGRQGRTAEATGLFGSLETLASAADDSVHLAWAWVGLAYDHYLAGRSVAAAAAYGQAAGVLERGLDPQQAIWAWNGRALVLRQAGQFLEAREALRRVLALAEAAGDELNAAIALNQLGRIEMLIGDPGRAIDLFGRSAAIHRGRQQHREGLVPCIDLAGARLQQGRLTEAAALLDSVLVVCRDLGLRDLEVLAGNNLADVRLAQDRPAAAAVVCRDLLAAGEPPSHLAATETRLRLARALAERDSTAAAAALLQQILAAGAGSVALELDVGAQLGACRLALGDPQGALAVLIPAVARAGAAGLDEHALILWTQVGRAQRRVDRPDSARVAFARAVEAWERLRRRPDDPTWREHQGAVGDLFAEAAANLLADPSVDGDLADAFALVQRGKARTLQERMMGPGAPAPAVPRIPTLAEVRARVLTRGEVLLDLVEGEQIAVLFVVTRDTALAALLPGRRVIAPRLRLLADAVTSPSVDDLIPVAALAGAALAEWPPGLTALLQDATLLTWSPDGSWHRFPLALLSGSAVGSRPDGSLALARVPSVAVLARLRAETKVDGDATLLAVCGPDPDGPGLLPGAEAETIRLAARYRGVRRSAGAVFDAAAWRGAATLHLAAHTRLDPWRPWNTTITLARGDGGQVRAADIAVLDLDARLAVLAGCATAGTRIVGGEGLIGLAGGFLAARTPAVVATLWPVDDFAAARFMDPFYRALADGRTVAEALAVARRACRADPATAAPRHWAGYVVVGDGGTTVPLQRRAARWPLALVLLAAAGGAVVRARC